MKYLRYVIGMYGLYWIGFMGGDIIVSALFLGLPFGFIDYMKGERL